MAPDPHSIQDNRLWRIVAAAALVLGLSMGMLINGLSAFLVPLEVHFGWERSQVAAISSVGLVGISLGGVLAGYLADRFSTRSICLTGGTVLSLALLLAARTNALWQFYFLFALAGAFGGGALFAPVLALVGNWSGARAGLAIGIASAGQGLGQGVIPFLSGYLIESLGWQHSFTVLGLVTATTLIPLSLLLVPAPPTQVQKGQEKAAAHLPSWLVLPALSLAVFCCCTAMSVPLIHLVPLIQGICGPGAQAGGPLLVMMVAAIAGRIFFGRLSDVVGPIPGWMIATAWQTTLVIGFVFLDSLQAFWWYAPLYGFGYGGVMTGLLVTIRAVTPPARRALSTGFVLAFAWFGHAFGGWQGGLFFDLFGSYFLTYANAVIAGFINLGIVGTIWLATRITHTETAPLGAQRRTSDLNDAIRSARIRG